MLCGWFTHPEITGTAKEKGQNVSGLLFTARDREDIAFSSADEDVAVPDGANLKAISQPLPLVERAARGKSTCAAVHLADLPLR